METILELLNYGLILIFGTQLSMLFSGVVNNRKNKWAFIALIILLLLTQIISWVFFGFDFTRRIYPFIIHIPLVFFIAIYYKCDIIITADSVLSSYLCCQTPQLFATIALNLFDSRIAYLIVNTLSIFPVFYLLKKYATSYVHRLMTLSKKTRLLFGIVPAIYYLFDYGTTVYTDLLYQGIESMVLFMPSVVSMLYFVLVVIYYNEIQRRSIVENEQILLSVQIKQSEKELASYLDTEEKSAIYRHNMRHHFNLITGFLKENDIQKASEYIAQTQSGIKEITPIRYCENNIVNMILSYFTTRAASSDIALSVDVQIPQSTAIADNELCTLLSNSLENAIIACAQVPDKKLRMIHINCKVHKEKLLIFIENSHTGQVEIENGLPKSNQPGHGFGVRSVVMIIKKYKGYYSYTAKDGIFTLKIVLPFQNKL